MSIEHGSTERHISSVERGNSSDRLSPAESLLIDIENGITPKGSVFVDAVRDNPILASEVLDLICEYTGATPSDAADVAKLFEFKSIEEVEYFFENLA